LVGEPVTGEFDVLGLGIVTIDDLLFVDAYPAPDEKVRINRRVRDCGGLTGTALVAAARLGARCAYAGVLGTDEMSRAVRAGLEGEGIDVSFIHPNVDVPPIHSTIVVDESVRTRTILFECPDDFGDDPEWPDSALIRAARVLFVDHKNAEMMTRAARIAREAGRAVVADYERDESPGFPELLAAADHLILSADFAGRITGQSDPRRAAERLWNDDRSAVVVTSGTGGCWWVDRECKREARHQPAFPVATVDTTGCGDVFHGAYAAELARGTVMTDRLRMASAAAALKATRQGGQAGIPGRSEVLAFLKDLHA
jgi:ribokinase